MFQTTLNDPRGIVSSTPFGFAPFQAPQPSLPLIGSFFPQAPNPALGHQLSQQWVVCAPVSLVAQLAAAGLIPGLRSEISNLAWDPRLAQANPFSGGYSVHPSLMGGVQNPYLTQTLPLYRFLTPTAYPQALIPVSAAVAQQPVLM